MFGLPCIFWANLTPLSLQAYEWGLAQYLGAGTAACYRGSRPYRDEPTRAMVCPGAAIGLTLIYLAPK